MIKFDALFKTMRQKHVTITDLFRAGVTTPATLQGMRKGHHVSTRTLDKICSHLGCNLDDVIHYVPDTTKKEGEEK